MYAAALLTKAFYQPESIQKMGEICIGEPQKRDSYYDEIPICHQKGRILPSSVQKLIRNQLQSSCSTKESYGGAIHCRKQALKASVRLQLRTFTAKVVLDTEQEGTPSTDLHNCNDEISLPYVFVCTCVLTREGPVLLPLWSYA